MNFLSAVKFESLVLPKNVINGIGVMSFKDSFERSNKTAAPWD